MHEHVGVQPLATESGMWGDECDESDSAYDANKEVEQEGGAQDDPCDEEERLAPMCVTHWGIARSCSICPRP